MIQIFSRKKKSEKLKEIDSIKRGSWINVTSPTEEELNWISEKTKIPLDEIRDTLDPNEVPRIEEENEYDHFIIRMPIKDDNTNIKTIPLGFFIFDKKILTVCKEDNRIIEEIIKKTHENLLTNKRSKLILPILAQINKYYKIYLNQIHRNIASKEVNIKKLKPDDIVDLVEIEKTLNYFISALSPTVVVFSKLLKTKILSKKAEVKELLEDIIIDNQQNLETSKTMQKIVMNTRNAYESILGNSLNKIMKLLTAITVVLTIPTITSGIYGMNVRLPLENNPHAFTYIIGLTLIISVFLLFIFNKNNWL